MTHEGLRVSRYAEPDHAIRLESSHEASVARRGAGRPPRYSRPSLGSVAGYRLGADVERPRACGSGKGRRARRRCRQLGAAAAKASRPAQSSLRLRAAPLAALRLALLLGSPLDVAGRPCCQRPQLGYRVWQRLGVGRLGPLQPDALHLLLRRRAQVSPARLTAPPTWLNRVLTITLR